MKEEKRSEGLSIGAKVAWCAVAFVFLFMVMPALAMQATSVPEYKPPAKRMITVPLYCYGDTEAETNRPVVVCDPPPTPNPTQGNP